MNSQSKHNTLCSMNGLPILQNAKNKYGLLTWRINEAYVKGGRTSVLLQKSRFLWISINRKNRVIMLFINVVSNFPITDRYLTCIKISSDYCNLKFRKIYLRFISCTINCGENKSTSILFCDVIFFSIFPKQSIISKERLLKMQLQASFLEEHFSKLNHILYTKIIILQSSSNKTICKIVLI